MATPTNDPLYDLAVQAGFFPAPIQDSFSGTGNRPADYTGGFDSPVTSPVQAPSVPSPSTTSPLAQPSAENPFGKVGAGASVSTRGYSEEQAKKVSKQDAPLEAKYREAQGQAEAGGALEAGIITEASKGEHKAAEAVAKATVDRITARGHAANLEKQLADSFAQDEMKMNMEAQAMSDQSKADYMAALADLRASRVDPGQLWSNMTPGVRFGTLVTAFVHDFLGAKGIKTSAMDTLNSAIDRNINAQVQAIKTKGEVAEGFKSLWWMQRNQAASDAEARARVRGFLLESVKQQVISNMTQYEAGLATAQGQAAIAAIDKELANNLVAIHRHIDQNALALRNQALEWHKAKLMASVQSASIAVQRDELAFRKKQADDAARAKMFENLIPDISDSGGGKMGFEFRPGISQAKKDETLTKVEFTGIMSKNAREYRDMLRQYNAINDLTAKNRFADTNASKMRELQIKIVLDDQLRRTGRAATEQERAQIAQRFPLNTWATQADVEQVVSGFEKHGLEDLNEALETVAVNLPKDDPRRQLTGAGGFGDAEYTEATTVHKRGSIDQGQRAVATQALNRPDKFEDAHPDTLKKMGVKDEAANDWESFKVNNPDAVGRYEDAQNSFAGGESSNRYYSRIENIPAGGAAAVALRKAAEAGDAQALQQLNDLAFPGNEAHLIDPNERMLSDFAKYELFQYSQTVKSQATKDTTK